MKPTQPLYSGDIRDGSPPISQVNMRSTSSRSTCTPHPPGQHALHILQVNMHSTSSRSTCTPHPPGQHALHILQVNMHSTSPRSICTPHPPGQHTLHTHTQYTHPGRGKSNSHQLPSLFVLYNLVKSCTGPFSTCNMYGR